MIETISDFLSVISMIAITLYSFTLLYRVSVAHREEVLRRREDRYYRYYEDEFASDEDENGDLYYGDES